ncbi:MAG TPA: hypothetical protein VH988_02410 [Thermoanaerobaculia bacterium]|jgi:hypothetical protein|nr:hypothetical protein [Thermoanaerobaculia bacterium]
MKCRVSLCLFLTLGFWAAGLATAQGFGNPLTQAQVDCEERQMMRLLHRVATDRGGTQAFLWRSTPGGGVYRGLVATSNLFGDGGDPTTWTHDEKQMPFDLILKAEDDFPNPQRLRLPQGTLVRRDAATNLTASADILQWFILTVDLAPEVPDPTMPTAPLRISNRLLVGAGQSDRGGRSLAKDDLLSACHAEVTEFDLKVYSILARTFRASSCLAIARGICPGYLYPFKVAFFRGVDPLTYRANILFYGDTCFDSCTYSQLTTAYLLHVQVDTKGNLTGGDLQALPWCTGQDQLACTNYENPELGIFILPPLRPGLEQQGPAEFQRAAQLQLESNGSKYNTLQSNVNWIDLLKDTSWNGGLQPPKP